MRILRTNRLQGKLKKFGAEKNLLSDNFLKCRLIERIATARIQDRSLFGRHQDRQFDNFLAMIGFIQRYRKTVA